MARARRCPGAWLLPLLTCVIVLVALMGFPGVCVCLRLADLGGRVSCVWLCVSKTQPGAWRTVCSAAGRAN